METFNSELDSNITVSDELQSFYKFGLISIGFCDRMMMVMILSGCSASITDSVTKYLTKNGFFKHDKSHVYCRFKSRNGEYITSESFDKENFGIRNEMVSRLIGKNKLYVQN